MNRPMNAGIRQAMVLECATTLNCAVEDLRAKVREFVEGDGNFWQAATRSYSLAQLTWISALLAGQVIEGIPLPKILEFVTHTQRVRDLVARLDEVAPDPETFSHYRTIFGEILMLVPCPACLTTTLEILRVRFEGSPPPTFLGLLTLVGAPQMLALPSGDIDAVKASELALVHGADFIREVIEAGVLPDTLEDLARNAGSRTRLHHPSTKPVEYAARLKGEACAILIYGAPPRLPSWASIRPVFRHLERLSEVLNFSAPATLYPSEDLLGAVLLDEVGALSYDQRLLDDASVLFEELLEHEQLPEAEARRRAFEGVMRGFQPFRALLERANAHGAQVFCLPNGIANAYGRRHQYTGVREDLCPRPAVYRRLLACLPELVKDEDDQLGKLAILQFVTAARASVVLGLDQSCWVDDGDGGVLLHVRSASNKTGRSVLYLAPAWMAFYQISRDWLPEKVQEDPANWLRDELSEVIERICKKFESMTGILVPRQSSRFTRNAMVQLLGTRLTGADREVITALLGHRARVTRANYWRPWANEVREAYDRWDSLGISPRTGEPGTCVGGKSG